MKRSTKKRIARRLVRDARAAQDAGELDEAVALYEKAIELHPTAEAHTFLGWSYSCMGRIKEAMNECLKAIEIDRGFATAYNDMGIYLIDEGRLDDACIWLEKAVRAERSEQPHFPYMNLGRVFVEKGQPQKALSYFRKALETTPDNEIVRQTISELEVQIH